MLLLGAGPRALLLQPLLPETFRQMPQALAADGRIRGLEGRTDAVP